MRYLIGLLFAAAMWADWTDTSTGIDLATLPHPRLTKVQAGEVFDGITVTRTDAGAVLRGSGKSGKVWSVSLCAQCLQEIWRGDLNGDATVDYAIVGVGPSDTAPWNSLSILLMDADGMPLPFFTAAYKDDGISNLILVDGKVRLLISRYDQIPSDPGAGPFCSGHWVTQAYGFSGQFVEEVRGVVAGMRFPFIRNWAYSHPECAHNPLGFSERPKVPEISTTIKGTADGCAPLQAEAIVYDSAAGREVAFPGEAQEKLADKIRMAEASVELRGVRDCTASLMWARSTK